MNRITAFIRRHMTFLLLGAAGVFLILVALERLDENERRRNRPDLDPKPVPVSAVVLGRGPVTEWVVGEGPAEAVRKRHLQFETIGTVEFLATDADGGLIREGSRVRGPERGERSGQMLARLDSREPLAQVQQSEAGLTEAHKGVEMEQAALAQARNELAEARSSHGRNRRLFEQKLLARSDFERSKTRFDNAREGVETAVARLAAARSKVKAAVAELNKSKRGQDKNAVFAPFDGVVARLNIRTGEYFDPENVDHSTPARLQETAPITVIDPSEMEVTLTLPMLDGRKVRVGQRAVVMPGALDWLGADDTGEERWKREGIVHSVSPQLDATGRAIRVKVRLHQEDGFILDGMFTNCWIAVDHKPDALRVPLAALLFRRDRPYVYVVANGTAQRRDIVLGCDDDSYAEVVRGVDVGETVALEGRQQLSNGAAVRVVETQ